MCAGWFPSDSDGGPRVLVGGVLFSFGVSATVSTNAWTGVAYYLGFGALLTFIASMGPRLRRIDPSSLRTRLALVLAAGVAVPLLVLVALYAKVEEREERSNVLAHQQALVTALAQDVDDYISLHEAALKLLVGLPGLLTLSPAEQHAILVNSKTAYPDVVGFGTVAADGQPIARADSLTGISWSGDAVFEGARRTKQPALDVRISPIIHHPIFTIGVPILDVDGRFAGMVSSSLESSRIAAFLTRIDLGIDAQTYLVDPAGRVIAHPDLGLVADFADLSATPTVNAFLNDPAPSGSLQVPMRGSVVLASYARVPGLGLGVIVERPAALAMATTYAKLNVLFVGLLVAIGAAAGFGAFAAEWLSRPLATLGAVVDGLAAGDDGSPLPTATLTEVTTLTDAFSAMRERVIGRTAELLASNRELEALYRVGQTITAPLQLDTVLNTIARCTAELLGTDAGAILIVDRATQTLSVQGAYGISDRAVRDTRDRVGESIAGRVVETGQPMVANDVPNNPLFVNPAADQEGLLAIASVPLTVGNKTIGTLDALSRTNRFAFDSHHIQVLQMLASQAAIAIENARLYQEVRIVRDELEERVIERTAALKTAIGDLKAAGDERLHTEETMRIAEYAARSESELAAARTAVLADVSRVLVENFMDHGPMLERVAHIAAVATQTACVIQLIAEDGDHISLLPLAVDHADEGVRLELARVLSAPHTVADSAWHGLDQRLLLLHPLMDSLSVPMLSRTATIGVLSLGRFGFDSTQFTDGDRKLGHDLSARVALAVENARLYENATKAIEVRDKFLTIAAHELKTPITTILGYSQLLSHQLQQGLETKPDPVRRSARLIEDRTRHLARLVEQILDVSRIVASRMQLNLDDTDLVGMMRNVVGGFERRHPAHEFRLHLPRGHVRAVVDAMRLEQVMANVIDNAVRYSPVGGPIEIRVEQRQEGSIVLSVRDWGLGIPEEHRPHIFERFHQGHALANRSGMGLSLHISREIIVLHGGKITAAFPVDGGSQFTVRLPRTVESAVGEHSRCQPGSGIGAPRHDRQLGVR